MPTQIVLPNRSMGLFASIGAVVVVVGLALIYLPRTTITVHPKISSLSVEQDITLSTSAGEPDFVRYVLPARVIQQDVTKKTSIKREGANIFDDFAKGSVIIVNEQDDEQSLLPKTHLRHEETGVFFLTDTPATVPAHSEIAMTVTAKEKGQSGNVPAGKFIVQKLPKSLQKLVYAESKQDFTGGISTDTPVSSEEITSAKEKLIEEARDSAVGELTLQTGGASIRDELISFDTLTEHISVEAGSHALEYNVGITVRARAFVVDDNDLLSLTLLALRAKESDDEEFLQYEPGSFDISIHEVDFERGEALITGTLTGIFARKIGPTVLSTENLAGLSADEIQDHFKQFENVGSVEVRFWPFWVKTVPSRPGAVEVIIQQDQ